MCRTPEESACLSRNFRDVQKSNALHKSEKLVQNIFELTRSLSKTIDALRLESFLCCVAMIHALLGSVIQPSGACGLVLCIFEKFWA